MRIRTIKPEFWTSETISRLSESARLFFIGLWSYVDDNGVGDARISQIAAAIYSVDLSVDPTETYRKVSENFLECLRENLIILFESTERKLIKINSWEEHQKVKNPSKGHNYPLPTAETEILNEKYIAAHTDSGRVSGGSTETQRRYSGDATETQTPGTGEQGNRGAGEYIIAPASKLAQNDHPATLPGAAQVGQADIARENKSPNGYTLEFEEFWKIYPRRKDKRKAFKAFQAAKKRASVDLIMATARDYAADPNRVDEFTPYPQGWLNGDPWFNDPEPVRTGGKPTVTSNAAAWLAMAEQFDDGGAGEQSRAF